MNTPDNQERGDEWLVNERRRLKLAAEQRIADAAKDAKLRKAETLMRKRIRLMREESANFEERIQDLRAEVARLKRTYKPPSGLGHPDIVHRVHNYSGDGRLSYDERYDPTHHVALPEGVIRQVLERPEILNFHAKYEQSDLVAEYFPRFRRWYNAQKIWPD